MNLQQITGIVFSPTGSTKRVVELIMGQIHGNKTSLDLTDAVSKRPKYRFNENEAVIVGVPVYGGRVPQTALERFARLEGRQTPAILVAVYGNRAYEDALLELKEELEKRGFRPVAAAAVIAEHNIMHCYGEGRPDDQDREAIRRFGKDVQEKLRAMKSVYETAELTVSGDHPYRPYATIPFKIKVSGACKECGLCIRKCPVQAISRTDPRVTDEARCISCMRCVKVCPEHARKVNPVVLFAATQKMKKVCEARKEPEFFL